MKKPGDYFTGVLVGEPFLVVRDESDQVRAFSNVCRHHAARVAEGEGHATRFVCPYHGTAPLLVVSACNLSCVAGWQYGLNGRLQKATKLKDIKEFA